MREFVKANILQAALLFIMLSVGLSAYDYQAKGQLGIGGNVVIAFCAACNYMLMVALSSRSRKRLK